MLLLPDLGLLPPVFLDTLPLRLAHKRVSVFAPLALIRNFAIKLAHTASNIRHDTTRRKKTVVRVRTCPSTKTCTAGVSHCRLSETCGRARLVIVRRAESRAEQRGVPAETARSGTMAEWRDTYVGFLLSSGERLCRAVVHVLCVPCVLCDQRV